MPDYLPIVYNPNVLFIVPGHPKPLHQSSRLFTYLQVCRSKILSGIHDHPTSIRFADYIPIVIPVDLTFIQQNSRLSSNHLKSYHNNPRIPEVHSSEFPNNFKSSITRTSSSQFPDTRRPFISVPDYFQIVYNSRLLILDY